MPSKQGARRTRLAELARIDATLVIFEGGSRIVECISDLAEILGDREVAICRELTKMHESILRARLPDLAKRDAADFETRGEFVVVIAPPQNAAMSDDDIDAHLRAALLRLSLKDAVAEVVSISQRPRREVYARDSTLQRPTMPKRDPGADTPEPPQPDPARQRAFRTGLSAESRAAAMLIAKGFRIVARRARTPSGEIDIIARRGKLLIFVEVKARASLDDAAFAVTPRQISGSWRRRNSGSRATTIIPASICASMQS